MGDLTTTIFMTISLYVFEISYSCADYYDRFYDHQHRAGQKICQQDPRAKGKGYISCRTADGFNGTHSILPSGNLSDNII